MKCSKTQQSYFHITKRTHVLVLFNQLRISESVEYYLWAWTIKSQSNKARVHILDKITGPISSLAFILSINCFVNLVKENLASFLPRTISICLYFAQSRLYKRFNFEVEVSLGKFSKQVCITSQSGRPTREIWRKKQLKKSKIGNLKKNWKNLKLEAQVCISHLPQAETSWISFIINNNANCIFLQVFE